MKYVFPSTAMNLKGICCMCGLVKRTFLHYFGRVRRNHTSFVITRIVVCKYKAMSLLYFTCFRKRPLQKNTVHSVQ